MAFTDPSIFQWQSQAQLVHVWEEYPPPFINDVGFMYPDNFFNVESAHYRSEDWTLFEMEQFHLQYKREREEEAFPHLMQFLEGSRKITGSCTENSVTVPSPTNPLKQENPENPGFSPMVPHFPPYNNVQVMGVKVKPTPPSPGVENPCHVVRLPENKFPKEEKIQEQDPELDLSQEDPEDERVDMSEEEIEESIGKKRRKFSDSDISGSSEKKNSDNNNKKEYNDTPDNTEEDVKNGTQLKKRQRTSPEQLQILEKVYEQEKLPSVDLRKELAQQLHMTPRRVQVWFQNKRAKEKRMVAAPRYMKLRTDNHG